MKKNQKKQDRSPAAAAMLRSGSRHPFGALDGYVPLSGREEALYRSLREALPVVDAAVEKLVRLAGGFSVQCSDKKAEQALTEFLRDVPCGRGQVGAESFLASYLSSLLTYGAAVGEMVVHHGHLAALCWGDVSQIHMKQTDNPLDVTLCTYRDGKVQPLPYQNLLLFTPRDPEPEHPYGVSLLRSMPFLADVLLKIYHTVGRNWERAGNVRYSVVYRPEGEVDPVTAQKRAGEMASAWRTAMQETKTGAVRDFVAVGDVSIKVIGADGQILDSQVPVRQIMEQLVAKTGLPPFLLGLSWASTERMASQQADILTSELWALRRTVEPVLRKICSTWLKLEGYGGKADIVWQEISLQDTLEESHAALYRAQAAQLAKEEQNADS